MESLVPFGVLAFLSAGTVWFVAARMRGLWGWRTAPAASGVAVASAGQSGRTLSCPSCGRTYAPGVRFCSHDARGLIPSEDFPGGHRAGASVVCRSCSRAYEPGTRYCPFDAEELAPPAAAAVVTSLVPYNVEPCGKICPCCTTRYDADETFCGRDGTALVTVN